jgi:two-component system sensor histidine kinase/response regulator
MPKITWGRKESEGKMYYKDVHHDHVMENAINQEQLLERVDGDFELLGELFTVFVEEFPTQLKEVKDAILTNNAEKLRRSAHRLKGALGNLAAEEAYESAIAMETHAINRKMTAARNLYREFEKQILIAIDALKSIVGNNGL